MNQIFEKLINELGIKLRIDKLKVSNNICAIGIDDIEILIFYDEEKELVIFYAKIADLAQENNEELYAKLLEGQLFFKETAGASLCIDSEHTEIIIEFAYPIILINSDQILLFLENFANLTRYWKNKCYPAAVENNIFQIINLQNLMLKV